MHEGYHGNSRILMETGGETGVQHQRVNRRERIRVGV